MLKLTAMSIDAFPPAAHGAQSGHREIHLGRRRIAAPSTQTVRGNPGVSRFRVAISSAEASQRPVRSATASGSWKNPRSAAACSGSMRDPMPNGRGEAEGRSSDVGLWAWLSVREIPDRNLRKWVRRVSLIPGSSRTRQSLCRRT